MNPDAVLTTTGLTKQFGGLTAVSDVSLTIQPGDVYGFLGLNGAGKTTTMRMILGLIPATRGTIRLFGASRGAGQLAARRRLGAMVEGPSFYPHLSGARNLKLIGSLSGPVTRERIAEVLDRVGLTAAADRRAGDYSLGMKQRLGIALAILSKPDFVVLDEPTNGLDPNGILEMRRLIRDLNRDDDVTFMISSHLLHEVEKVCTRVGILEKGRLILEADMDDVAHRMGGRYHLVAQPLEKARTVIEAIEGTDDVEVDGKKIVFRLAQDRLPALHARLVEHDVRVWTLSEERIHLEEFFLDQSAERARGALT